MKTPVWILRETVLALHEQLIARFGGASGLRDANLLDSALPRPQHLLAYGTPTLFQLAASYGYGLVKNHPFVDGNKRIGFTVVVLFLELNGCSFQFPAGPHGRPGRRRAGTHRPFVIPIVRTRNSCVVERAVPTTCRTASELPKCAAP